MNPEKACMLLDISIDSIDIITLVELKQKYRIKALYYHPDKNRSPDAVKLFQEINESYDFLMKYTGFMDDEDDCVYKDIDESNIDNYKNILFSFIKNIFDDESKKSVLYAIINRILYVCEKTALNTLNNIDYNILIKLYDFLKIYKISLHISDEFITKLSEIIIEKENASKNNQYIILNPLLDDLLNDNLYKLSLNGFNYLVPLWHNELVYDNSGCDLNIKCYPVLPDNITIDEDNNIEVFVEYSISEIWSKVFIEVNVGYLIFPIDLSLLKIKQQQQIVFYNKGISRINTEDVYDVSCRASVYINIKLTL